MKIVLIISLVVNVWFASSIIKLEKFHYSAQVGMCDKFQNETDKTKWLECNNKQETRTNPIWHLYNGLAY